MANEMEGVIDRSGKSRMTVGHRQGRGNYGADRAHGQDANERPGDPCARGVSWANEGRQFRRR